MTFKEKTINTDDFCCVFCASFGLNFEDEGAIRAYKQSFQLCSILSKTLFITEQNGSKLQDFAYKDIPLKKYECQPIYGQHNL